MVMLEYMRSTPGSHPVEIIEQYNPRVSNFDGWLHIRVRKGTFDSNRLARFRTTNLPKHLAKFGYTPVPRNLPLETPLKGYCFARRR
jgi:hypothetical protein